MLYDTLPSQDVATHQIYIPVSKNIGDMHKIRCILDTRSEVKAIMT